MDKESSQQAFKKEYPQGHGIREQTPMDLNLPENKHGVKNQVTDLKTEDAAGVLDIVGNVLTDTAQIDITYDNVSDPKTISAVTIGKTRTFTVGGFTLTFVKGLLTNAVMSSESPSVSPSSSVSPSASKSPSVSPSQSPSASVSPSASKSPSLSPSVSPSASISPSLSPS